MRSFVRWASILGLVAIAFGVAPTWRTDEFFEIKRVRVLSIGVLHPPVLRVRDVFVPVARGATEWTRLHGRLDWEPFGTSAVVLLTGCALLGAALVARGRAKPVLERATS